MNHVGQFPDKVQAISIQHYLWRAVEILFVRFDASAIDADGNQIFDVAVRGADRPIDLRRPEVNPHTSVRDRPDPSAHDGRQRSPYKPTAASLAAHRSA
ncbi:hypothetical protein [Rhodococcus sp. 24CO]|uniref:hypothetical protein n=1 Tax=Rhodococcus sp. 24CO TaxID=3117460 RepID=UPI003D339000